ncbi:uncharacterized protein LOC122048333 [Zingiber officinale]|uniref:uncharacterized protein LOC122048333 n=1 Tax=Zingiber officinale TaxID=94328 RepID=UPI001C4B81D1|nr:uncharacterized protein LOC122048333 [Zingiber officinale]
MTLLFGTYEKARHRVAQTDQLTVLRGNLARPPAEALYSIGDRRYTDGVKYRVFLTTLSESAQRWFRRLPDGYIRNFKDFRAAFLHQFASSRRYQKTSVSLFSMKQGSKETLRAYIQRFNKVAIDIPSVSSETMMNAFTQGFVEREFFRSVIRKAPRDFDHLLRKANKYINVEEAQAARKKEAPTEPTLAPKRHPMNSHQPPRGPKVEAARPHQEARTHAVQHVSADRQKASRGKVWTPMFCSFHQSAVYNTQDCRGLTSIASRLAL